MPRIGLITDREGLDEATREVFDWVVASRGRMIRPFEVLLHVPALARPVAELGHVVRYASGLADGDRELAILATGRAHRCDFVWDSHIELARHAGVSEDAIAFLEGEPRKITSREQTIIDVVRSLVATSAVDDETYGAATELLGEAGVIELATTIGYYTMLGFAMGVAAAC